MGILYAELIDTIEKLAPPFLMEEWDNSGLQIKVSNEKIDKILIALEINEDVIEEAVSNSIDFIVTHHPLFFNDIKQINDNDILGRYVNKLITRGISVYSAHTTFDKAMGGNNDFLISLINLDLLSEVGKGSFEEFGIGRLVKLKTPATLNAIIQAVTQGLKIPEGETRKVGDGKKEIHKIGICTGSGASLIDDAAGNGCQLLITGDIKYHDARHAKDLGICLLDAGHYYTERIFPPNFAEKLKKLIGKKVVIMESEININPFG